MTWRAQAARGHEWSALSISYTLGCGRYGADLTESHTHLYSGDPVRISQRCLVLEKL